MSDKPAEQQEPEVELSRSGRPVYRPSTLEWVLWALTVAGIGTGLSAFGDGDTLLGIGAIAAGIACAAVALLIRNRRR